MSLGQLHHSCSVNLSSSQALSNEIIIEKNDTSFSLTKTVNLDDVHNNNDRRGLKQVRMYLLTTIVASDYVSTRRQKEGGE